MCVCGALPIAVHSQKHKSCFQAHISRSRLVFLDLRSHVKRDLLWRTEEGRENEPYVSAGLRELMDPSDRKESGQDPGANSEIDEEGDWAHAACVWKTSNTSAIPELHLPQMCFLMVSFLCCPWRNRLGISEQEAFMTISIWFTRSEQYNQQQFLQTFGQKLASTNTVFQ